MSKRTAGAALICGAVVLALAAFLWWGKQSSDLDYDHGVWEFEVPMAQQIGNPIPEEPTANRAGPIALGGLAAVLFLGGVVLVAVSPPPDAPDSSDRPSPSSAAL